MQTSRLLSSSSDSPSFSSFSSTVDLAAVASRVVDEFRDQDSLDVDEDDFEFAFDCSSHRCSHPVATADQIFCNGQIRPLNPYGGVIGNSPVRESQATPKSSLPRTHRPALRKLMSEDRDQSSNSSSEAEEDLIGVPPETYCVWTPKQSDDLSKIRSNSVGFSKRWKLRNILNARSRIAGKEKLVFPAPLKKNDVTTISDQGEEEKPTSKEEERESENTKNDTSMCRIERILL